MSVDGLICECLLLFKLSLGVWSVGTDGCGVCMGGGRNIVYFGAFRSVCSFVSTRLCRLVRTRRCSGVDSERGGCLFGDNFLVRRSSRLTLLGGRRDGTINVGKACRLALLPSLSYGLHY